MKPKVTPLVLVTALIVPASAEAASEAACAVKGSKTVLATKNARVFTIPGLKANRDTPNGRRNRVRLFYGCLPRTGKRSFLGGDLCSLSLGAVETLRLAGDYVAYTRNFCGTHSDWQNLSVTSLRSGRRTRVLPAFTGPPPSPPPCPPGEECPVPTGNSSRVTGFKLKANGSIAWIAVSSGMFYTVQVRKSDRSASNALLDSSSYIDPHSLRLSRDGKTIRWTEGRSRRSFPLR